MFLGPGAMSPEHNIETMRLAKILNPDSESPERSFPAIPIVIVLAIISFSPVLVAGYVRLDDYDNILRNPSVQSFSLSGFKAIWTESRLGFYIPITYSIWWLYAGLANALGTLSQSAPLFHSVNLTLHILNTLLVFSLSNFASPSAPQTTRLKRLSYSPLLACGGSGVRPPSCPG